ncbi:hypothetical protein [Ralstonia phage RP13]|nr:hypothetical protein [Ralstonia phage RP13]
MRKHAREFQKLILEMLPAEYNRQVTAELLAANRRIQVLENQLMRRDGYVICSDQ